MKIFEISSVIPLQIFCKSQLQVIEHSLFMFLTMLGYFFVPLKISDRFGLRRSSFVKLAAWLVRRKIATKLFACCFTSFFSSGVDCHLAHGLVFCPQVTSQAIYFSIIDQIKYTKFGFMTYVSISHPLTQPQVRHQPSRPDGPLRHQPDGRRHDLHKLLRVRLCRNRLHASHGLPQGGLQKHHREVRGVCKVRSRKDRKHGFPYFSVS